jgi:hypothetical protein
MSNETSHLQNIAQTFGQIASQQASNVASFFGEIAKWNALHTSQAESVASEMQKLTKESFTYMSEVGAEVRKAQLAAAKKGLALWGIGS